MIVHLGGLIVRKGCGEFRPVRDGEAFWPVCERAPVGDGEIDLTFMRLPCTRALLTFTCEWNGIYCSQHSFQGSCLSSDLTGPRTSPGAKSACRRMGCRVSQFR